MDGGSTDGSVPLLESSHLPNLIWKSESDRGQSHALNKALSMSSGQILGWINSDDAYVDRRAVAVAVSYFDRHPDVGVVYGHSLSVDGSNRILRYHWSPQFHPRLFELTTFWLQPSAFFRRSIVEDGFIREDLNYVMDRDLWVRLAKKTKIARLNMVIAIDREHPFRKSLHSGLNKEYREYERNRGTHFGVARAVQRDFLKAMVRWRGILPYLALPKYLEPCIELKIDAAPARAWSQAFRSKRSILGESDVNVRL
jgi:GT2 family glycosyltransferase